MIFILPVIDMDVEELDKNEKTVNANTREYVPPAIYVAGDQRGRQLEY